MNPRREVKLPYPLSRRAHSTGLCDLPRFGPGQQAGQLAEGEGFEPPVTCATTVFKTAAINRSAIPPWRALIPLHAGV